MRIDPEALRPEVLRALAEEFVSREGTDYGEREIPFERKVEELLARLRSGEVTVVFDAATESCDLRESRSLSRDPAPVAGADSNPEGDPGEVGDDPDERER